MKASEINHCKENRKMKSKVIINPRRLILSVLVILMAVLITIQLTK